MRIHNRICSVVGDVSELDQVGQKRYLDSGASNDSKSKWPCQFQRSKRYLDSSDPTTQQESPQCNTQEVTRVRARPANRTRKIAVVRKRRNTRPISFPTSRVRTCRSSKDTMRGRGWAMVEHWEIFSAFRLTTVLVHTAAILHLVGNCFKPTE